jgi:dihydrofolate reductase
MGRKTYESIGRPLDRRDNIVVTRASAFHPPGVIVARGRDSALDLAEAAGRARGVDEVMIIGGAEIFRLFLEEVDLVYLTEVHAFVEGNAYFDKDFSTWREAKRVDLTLSKTDQYPFTFRLLINPTSRLAKTKPPRVSKRLARVPLAAAEQRARP